MFTLKRLSIFGVILFVIALFTINITSTGKNSNASILQTGLKAPNFSLPATGGKNVSLNDFKGKNLIIVFYPMDNTPGCTAQLCALRDEYSMFKSLNTEVIGSNPASVSSHEKFAKKQSYPFPLLADEKKEMAKAYNVDGNIGFNRRTVYILDGNGIVRFGERGTPTIGTLQSVIKRINSGNK